MSDSDLYSYTPLPDPNGQIRILKIAFDVKAAYRHRNLRPISGSMKTYYLPKSALSRPQRAVRAAQIPVFTALSYVWGDPSRTHEIMLDGKRLKITKNLYSALRDLQTDSISHLYVWADAICINQEDLDERSAQVLLMREIYHSATLVQIWFGSPTTDGKRCLKFILDLTGQYYDSSTPDEDSEERIGKAILFPTGAAVNAALRFGQSFFDVIDIVSPNARDDKVTMILDSDGDHKTLNKFTEWRPSNKGLKKVESEDFAEIATLFDLIFIQGCSWFDRMWVVQELGVSFSPRVVYDGTSMPWECFLRTAYYLHYTLKLPLPGLPKLTGLERIRSGWTDSKRLPLYSLIRECQYKQASDPRDRVYALLGLMGDRMNPLLQPDYTKSIGEVYALTTQHFIFQCGSLDPICGWQTYNRQDLPSWIPDFSLDQSEAASPLVVNYGTESLFSSSGQDQKGKYQIGASPLQDWSCLHVSGIFLDSVAILSPPTSNKLQFGAIEQTWRSTILQGRHLLRYNIKDLEFSLNSVSSVVSNYSKYWETARTTSPHLLHSTKVSELTLADIICQYAELQLNEVNEPTGDNRDIIEMYIQSLLCGRGTTRARLTGKDIRTIMRLRIPTISSSSQASPINLVCTAFENGMNNRAIAISTKGYTCVLPRQARKGDILCVMFGCSVPVVLRKKESSSSYTFVGECYMHGFMDGEAIAMQMKGALVEKKIVLA